MERNALDRAYLAGWFERGGAHQCGLQNISTRFIDQNADVLFQMQLLWGGVVKNNVALKSFVWVMTGTEAVAALKECLPYMRSRGDRMQAMLDMVSCHRRSRIRGDARKVLDATAYKERFGSDKRTKPYIEEALAKGNAWIAEQRAEQDKEVEVLPEGLVRAPKEPEHVALLDGDVILHKICWKHAGHGAAHYFPGSSESDMEAIYRDADWMIRIWSEGAGCIKLHVVFSDSHNWRKDVMPEYKSNRKGRELPPGFHELKKYIKETYRTMQRPNLEADDVCGMMASRKGTATRYIAVSIDKDFAQIPGKRFNPDKPELGIMHSTEQEADMFHMLQVLAGDPTDGYHGVPGVGMPTAAKLLMDVQADPQKVWAFVESIYEKKGLDKRLALVTARVSRILRNGDIRGGNVCLWRPSPKYTTYWDPEFCKRFPPKTKPKNPVAKYKPVEVEPHG